MKYLIYFLCIAALFLSCQENTRQDIGATTYEVDPVFEPYVQEFIQEGAKRGQDIDFSDTGLKVEFSDQALEDAAGFCYLNRHHIVIDKSRWFSFSESFRSYLLFHELGHCELDQLHRNDKFENNIWKSIMRGSPFSGLERRIPVPYYGFRKEYYIDELFDPSIPEPDWSKATFRYDQPLNKTTLIQQENKNRLRQQLSEIPSSFEVETFFSPLLKSGTIIRLNIGASDSNYFIQILNSRGLYIGVTDNQIDNYLFYKSNSDNINNRPINKITIRQMAGLMQVFINDEFIFHSDALPAIDYVSLEATEEETLLSTFDIQSLVVYELEE